MTAFNVLVVDDSRTIRVQLGRLLSEAGYRVTLAANGEEGLRLATKQPPRLVILDIQMPGMDGYAVCQELRQLGPPWDRLPVILLTSLESHALQLLGHELGAYLQKPVRRDALLEAVGRFLPLDHDRGRPAAGGSNADTDTSGSAAQRVSM